MQQMIRFVERTKAENTGETAEEMASGSENLAQTEEGYSYEGNGYSVSVNWIESENGKIFGRFYYPEGFDESQSYKTVLMGHGGNITADIWDTVYAPTLARNGYVCFAYDSRSGSEGGEFGRASYSDPAPEDTSGTATYIEDMNAALDFIEAKDFADKDYIYVVGQSMGGVTAQAVASERSDEIAGVVVLYGSLDDENAAMLDNYEEVKANPYSNGEILFIQGLEDPTLSPERTEENMTWYEYASMLVVGQASHGFGYAYDRPSQIAIETIVDFFERTSTDMVEE